jgi:hypothetical protein
MPSFSVAANFNIYLALKQLTIIMSRERNEFKKLLAAQIFREIFKKASKEKYYVRINLIIVVNGRKLNFYVFKEYFLKSL